ncbi:MAG: phosphotransferase [Myxococcota bacterium]|nr:phosphotransferase [Myxococcota bacterium]
MSLVHGVLNHYSIGALAECYEIKSGLMHSTYGVNARKGQFILQRLHPKLATAEIIQDYEAMTSYLAEQGLVSPRLIRTIDDQAVHLDEQGHWWRLTTRLPGTTPDKVEHIRQVEQGARALGRFHRAVSRFDYVFKSQHPLHDTAGHLSRLRDAVARPDLTIYQAPITDEINQILDLLPQLMLPETLPRRVVHGDPKISNILFKDGDAIGLIDLDTCNQHTVLVDLGDAIRSWCRDGSEDERHRFQLDRFEALLRGYATDGPSLTRDEIEWFARSGRLITLELASRFARDALEDEYFAFDETRYPDRRAHNYARTRAMIYLAEDMRRHQDAMDDLVASYLR